MFTLKLYRRHPATGTKTHKVISVHRVIVNEIGSKGQALELWAFTGAGNDYEAYYIGKPEEGMDAHGRDDLHLNFEPYSWWGWGLLENWEGNTSEHYRPHNFG